MKKINKNKIYKIFGKYLININNTFKNDLKRDNIFDTEWSYLIVIDACRYDIFKKINMFKGFLTKNISEGSCTSEWIFKNIKNSKHYLKDIIYVSANPTISNINMIKEFGYNPFYKIIDVWKNGWSDNLNTVHPKEVNKNVIINLSKYANYKFKYIIHYMQPHHPFIGKNKILDDGWKDRREKMLHNKIMFNNEKVWDLLRMKKIKKEEAYNAYKSNLRLVFEYIEKILPMLKGKICLTSDHGNLFGKYGILYGHPCNYIDEELLSVPWFDFI
jgi:hypothetical protein